MKKAIITGVTGQDGAYLADYLIKKGYKVYGGYRRSSSTNTWRIDELGLSNNVNFKLVELDVIDMSNCLSQIDKLKPHEIYNLAAQSFVGVSFQQPSLTTLVNSIGALNILESIKAVNRSIKYYQASTSEMFGAVHEIPQNENTIFHPRSPYGVSKLYAHWATINYRETYDMYAVNGILFNHESPLRGLEFVTRKIVVELAKIKIGQTDCLKLGNLDSKRDWGYAPEYVEGMWLMLQQNEPDDYVLATNRTETVRNFLKIASRLYGFNIEFEGDGINEIGIDKNSNKTIVRIAPEYYRECEVDLLIGDATKANNNLNWEAKTKLESLCRIMVDAELKRFNIS